MSEKKFAAKPLDAKASRAPKPADEADRSKSKPDVRDESAVVAELKKVKAEDLVEAIYRFSGRAGVRLLQSALEEIARRKAVNDELAAKKAAISKAQAKG